MASYLILKWWPSGVDQASQTAALPPGTVLACGDPPTRVAVRDLRAAEVVDLDEAATDATRARYLEVACEQLSVCPKFVPLRELLEGRQPAAESAAPAPEGRSWLERLGLRR